LIWKLGVITGLQGILRVNLYGDKGELTDIKLGKE
jgi:hypothetical protein